MSYLQEKWTKPPRPNCLWPKRPLAKLSYIPLQPGIHCHFDHSSSYFIQIEIKTIEDIFNCYIARSESRHDSRRDTRHQERDDVCPEARNEMCERGDMRHDGRENRHESRCDSR